MQHKNVIRLSLSAMIVTVLAIVAFGGMAVTAYAAQGALPGDALFSVKTGMEQARAALTHNAIERAKLNLQFADRRLDDMIQLAQQGRYQDLDAAAAEFQTSMTRAMDALGTTSIGNQSAQVQEMDTMVAGTLTRQSLTMKQLAASLPETAKPAVQDALATVNSTKQSLSDPQETSGDGLQYHGTVEAIQDTAWVINGVSYAVDALTIIEGNIQVGDPVDFFVFSAAGGSQTLWKVELASSTDGQEDNMGEGMGSGNYTDDLEDISSMDQASKGTVEAISTGSWTIDGVTYLVDENTKIEDTIQAGDVVEFHSYTTADGKQALASVELKSQDDQSGQSMDDMQDDTYKDGNQSGGTSYDDQEDNSQPGNTTPNYDSQNNQHEDDQNVQSFEDGQSQNSGSGSHSGDQGGDHEDHDD